MLDRNQNIRKYKGDRTDSGVEREFQWEWILLYGVWKVGLIIVWQSEGYRVLRVQDRQSLVDHQVNVDRVR